MATSAAIPQQDAVTFSSAPFVDYQQRVRIERAWAMPKADATRIKPVSTLLVGEFGDNDVLDPFHMPTNYIDHNEYALDILRAQAPSSQAAVLFRPPTTFRQAERYIRFVWGSGMGVPRGGRC